MVSAADSGDRASDLGGIVRCSIDCDDGEGELVGGKRCVPLILLIVMGG